MPTFGAIVEIPKNSRLKYEVDKSSGRIVLDRVLNGSNVYPQNYGYIEETLDLDGDPMDVLIISSEVLFPGCGVEVRVVGAMRMIDSGDRDTKFLAVIESDPRYENVQNISDVSAGILREIEDFFKNYKNLEGKTVSTDGFMDVNDAMKLLSEGRVLFNSRK